MKTTLRTMVVAGVMSGTSADGVDVALVRISPAKNGLPRLKVLGHRSFAYSRPLRKALLCVMNGEAQTAANFSRLNWQLGGVYADCMEKTCAELGAKVALVGLHGQTVYHQGEGAMYLGRAVRATWQMGEAAVLRERLRVPVISDFRAADLAAGGQGAPLVPMLDFCMLRSAKVHRILLNLGGIANVTVIPAGARLSEVMAFDTGPGNMIMDSIMTRRFSKAFDRGGRVATRGRVLPAVLREVLADRYFRSAPPKSCGREQFGGVFAERLMGIVEMAGGSASDAVTTAAELTAESVAAAIEQFCLPRLGAGKVELLAAGGGTRNHWLMRRLAERLEHARVSVGTVEEMGLDVQAKEAVAFALLAWLSWHGKPGNVPSATGATHSAILGKVNR